jgi:hypothetical protein
MLRFSRIPVALAAALVAGGFGTGSALAVSPIGPNQHFIGLVNGKHTGAVIYTVCPGPAGGNRTGPPAGNQTVAVKRVHSGGGDTGAGGHSIGARITPTTVVTIDGYGDAEPVPTSARVPCDGSGTVAFSSCPLPQPCGAGARVDDVPVRFINIAA